MATARKRRILTPVDITARYPSFRTGRQESWAAVSRDGEWRYERLEITGTPWAVIYTGTGDEVEGDWYGTLAGARAATADGSAMDAVNRIRAHERGDHEQQRDPCCIKC